VLTRVDAALNPIVPKNAKRFAVFAAVSTQLSAGEVACKTRAVNSSTAASTFSSVMYLLAPNSSICFSISAISLAL